MLLDYQMGIRHVISETNVVDQFSWPNIFEWKNRHGVQNPLMGGGNRVATKLFGKKKKKTRILMKCKYSQVIYRRMYSLLLLYDFEVFNDIKN